jgi:pyruvate,water dikinase
VETASEAQQAEIKASRRAAASTGRASVLTSFEEYERLGKGDVLVSRDDTPAWTPLFAVAGAIVTDGGGMLSHTAIAAREYGIPAVVGARAATRPHS